MPTDEALPELSCGLLLRGRGGPEIDEKGGNQSTRSRMFEPVRAEINPFGPTRSLMRAAPLRNSAREVR